MKRFFGIGGIFYYIIKSIIRFFNTLCYFLFDFLTFTGLYIPLLYSIYSAFIFLAGLKLSPFSVDAMLFYIGLILSFVCSIIITVKKLIINPASKLKDKFRRNRYNFHSRKNSSFFGSKKESPLIYRSLRRPDWIIYEYYDKFEVYEEKGKKLKFVKLVVKDK